MSCNAISSYGTALSMGPFGGSLTLIAEMLDLSGPSMESGVEVVTPHDAGTTPWACKIATTLDAGEVTFDINMVPTGVSAITTAFTDRTKRDFSLVFPDTGSTTWLFAGLVTGFQPEAPVEGALRASVTITVLDAINFSG